MNEPMRLAAWLAANAKHMKYEEERVEMLKAARMMRILCREIDSNLDALRKAHEMLKEVRGFANELSKQEAARDRAPLPVPVVRS